MNLNRIRDALSPSAAGERPRNGSEDDDEREPVFTTRAAAASGGAAAQFDTAAYTDVRGQAQDLGSDLEQEEAVTSLSTQDAMRVAESLSVEGPKQALSLGLMAQKKLQDPQFFVDNEAFIQQLPEGPARAALELRGVANHPNHPNQTNQRGKSHESEG